ncbi:TerB family tellurite resistance protein [Denitromonas iodatirespirans]|uniref:TerB family tellurite resistance protein n=1 Tax=Denitromonas iodatirespirans TaxID=2795389 RepID=A0A944DEQ6_DENI1|nr:TerB family tellurite resistance protein [Denitromonas iodatirespirans]MBT0963711.1 TerB family tellurite resistance protein [Denitromonas iodatirespirans]
MRSYPDDSTEAVARVVSLAMLVDGGLDPAETALVARSGMIEQLGLSPDGFDRVVQDFCHDLLQCSAHWSAGRLSLSPEVVEQLLGEIHQPAQRVRLLRTMLEIVAADGRVTQAEAALLSHAMRRWGDDLEH